MIALHILPKGFTILEVLVSFMVSKGCSCIQLRTLHIHSLTRCWCTRVWRMRWPCWAVRRVRRRTVRMLDPALYCKSPSPSMLCLMSNCPGEQCFSLSWPYKSNSTLSQSLFCFSLLCPLCPSFVIPFHSFILFHGIKCVSGQAQFFHCPFSLILLLIWYAGGCDWRGWDWRPRMALLPFPCRYRG